LPSDAESSHSLMADDDDDDDETEFIADTLISS
jgi:hypothetical protein